MSCPLRSQGSAESPFSRGSTIGNLDAAEARLFLQRVRRHVGHDGKVIIGADMKKDLKTVLAAYDDAAGVTALFNRDLLKRLNRKLGGDFRPGLFEHSARWNETESAIEMHLVSSIAQTVTVAGHSFTFDRGETIHTESSRKCDVSTFTELFNDNGWAVDHVWTDRHHLFSVFGLS